MKKQLYILLVGIPLALCQLFANLDASIPEGVTAPSLPESFTATEDEIFKARIPALNGMKPEDFLGDIPETEHFSFKKDSDTKEYYLCLIINKDTQKVVGGLTYGYDVEYFDCIVVTVIGINYPHLLKEIGDPIVNYAIRRCKSLGIVEKPLYIKLFSEKTSQCFLAELNEEAARLKFPLRRSIKTSDFCKRTHSPELDPIHKAWKAGESFYVQVNSAEKVAVISDQGGSSFFEMGNEPTQSTQVAKMSFEEFCSTQREEAYLFDGGSLRNQPRVIYGKEFNNLAHYFKGRIVKVTVWGGIVGSVGLAVKKWVLNPLLKRHHKRQQLKEAIRRSQQDNDYQSFPPKSPRKPHGPIGAISGDGSSSMAFIPPSADAITGELSREVLERFDSALPRIISISWRELNAEIQTAGLPYHFAPDRGGNQNIGYLRHGNDAGITTLVESLTIAERAILIPLIEAHGLQLSRENKKHFYIKKPF